MIEGRYAVPIIACMTREIVAIVVILLRVGPARIVAQSPKMARRTVR
jgi:hypothetical protein